MANEIKIRDLRPDEIEIKVDEACEQGVKLLLYKDARCDMNILDETFGMFGWKRRHSRDNANCIVSIKNPETGEWIDKEDVGSADPRGLSEYEKAMCSDSFKRACTNVGVGRELYSAPTIAIPASRCHIVATTYSDSGFDCRDRFAVKDIVIKDKRITVLSIVNKSLEGRPIVFAWERGRGVVPIPEKDQAPATAKTTAATAPAPAPAQAAAPAPSAAPTPAPAPAGNITEAIARAKMVRSPIRKHKGMTFGEVIETDPNDAKGALEWIAKTWTKDEQTKKAAEILLTLFAA